MSYPTFDKQLELKALGVVADSPAEQDTTGVALAVRMAGDFKAVIYVSAFEEGSPPGPITLSVETDSTADFDDGPVAVGSVDVSAAGVYEIPLSGKAIEQRDPDAAAIRISAAMTDGQSITYGAYLTPAV